MFRENDNTACRILYLPLLIVMLTAFQGMAQSVSRKHTSGSHQHYYDSLAAMKYNGVFPLLGDKVYKKGFDLPLPFGVMVNTFYGNQDIRISDMQVGVKAGDSTLGPVDMSKVVVFDKVNSKTFNTNVRVDMWVLPFLNIYGLAAWIPKATTSVSMSQPVTLQSSPSQHGMAYGLGAMLAGGIGPLWLQADYNTTWADMQLLENKVHTQISGFRAGHVFTSRKSAERNFSVWAGVMGIFINNNTVGQIKLKDVFPGLPQEKVDEIKESYEHWYNQLPKVSQRVVDKIVQGLQDKISGLPVDDIYVTYRMNKSIKTRWAGLMGAQYQLNKKWQLRVESNFIGKDRFSVLASVNYRFTGFKK